MSKEPGSLVKASVEVDAVKGKIAVSGEVSRVESIVQAFRSPKAKIQHAMAERLAAHIASGKPLSDATAMEQSMLIEACADLITKGTNRRQVIERALAYDPGIAGLLAAPGSSQPGTSQAEPAPEQAEHDADERQRFWEQFWAGAESTSVEYVQEIYARILTGQIRHPKSFSLSTLEVLRRLDRHAAELFKEIVPLALQKGFIPSLFDNSRGLGMGQLLTLVDANLVSGTQGTAVAQCAYNYGPWFIRIGEGIVTAMPILYPLTKAGKELIAITGVEISAGHALYAVWICEALTRNHHPCEVALSADGPWTDWKEVFKDAIAEQLKQDAEDAKKKANG